MEENQKQYELILILPPQLEGEDLDNAKTEIEEIIKKFKGIIEFKQAEKKDLAYPINKQGQGIYLITQLNIVPDNVNNLSKELKLNKKVLRHLISILPEIKETKRKPAPKRVLKKKIEQKKQETKKTTDQELKAIDQKLDDIIDKI